MTTYPQPTDPVSALSRADGTTEAHSEDHGRVIGIWENVKHFGAVGNGTTDDTTAINAAVAAVNATGGSLFFPMLMHYTGLKMPKDTFVVLSA